MKHKKNKIIHFLIFGSIYLNVEVIVRAICCSLNGINGISRWSLCGWTSLWMFPIGGMCALVIGSLNDREVYYKLKMWQQVIIGGSLITAVELLSGTFLNMYLGLSIWNYSYEKCNFFGQICLKNCFYWYLLSVVIIWFDDELSYYIYGEEKPESLINYFKKLFTNK
ncbi:hypothetical protein D4Z93_06260 [Clostridium fermenticellae]|uniref:ABC-transporter type IV n=1 Tax=Clostridium fermenticellae TaxID=2068654 RepID=A0A386H349_9CLOT|nr:hypothetical protein D4Z93_06260 [Clostridium fermenticellae]